MLISACICTIEPISVLAVPPPHPPPTHFVHSLTHSALSCPPCPIPKASGSDDKELCLIREIFMRTEDFFGLRRQQSVEGRRDSYVFAEGSGERTSSFWDAYTWGRTRSPLNWEMGELSCHGKTAPRIVNGGSGEGRLGECEEFSWMGLRFISACYGLGGEFGLAVAFLRRKFWF